MATARGMGPKWSSVVQTAVSASIRFGNCFQHPSNYIKYCLINHLRPKARYWLLATLSGGLVHASTASLPAHELQPKAVLYLNF